MQLINQSRCRHKIKTTRLGFVPYFNKEVSANYPHTVLFVMELLLYLGLSLLPNQF